MLEEEEEEEYQTLHCNNFEYVFNGVRNPKYVF
jgi:hypothetical protein